jgi:hypothetical protein
MIRFRNRLISSLVLIAFVIGCSPTALPPSSSNPSNKNEVAKDAPPLNSNATDETAKVAATKPSEVQKPPIDESLNLDELLEARLSADDLAVGWIRLFDGQSLFGWQSTSDANWRVEGGAIVVDNGAQGFLSTKCRYADFELQLEYKSTADTNSGVFLRCAPDMKSPATDCYELNIAPPSNPFPTGSVVERQRTEPDKLGNLNPDDWHSLHALVDRDHIQTWINGIETSNYVDDKGLTNGKLMLQFREGPVAFRNIRLRPIGYSVIPAENLDGWLPSDKNAFKYSRTDEGFIQLDGGKADLELLQQLQNFCVQLRVQTQSDGVNSGVFFRCVPGSLMDGYECQINNLFDGDRRRPKDFGTGAIFRRTKARAVLSDDHQDAFLTVIADGPSISTWVQGVQVVDWIDDRKPHENPREGYRAEGGSLQLQAHDPTCKILFKSLLISPIDEIQPTESK